MVNKDAVVAIVKKITEKKGAPCKKHSKNGLLD